MKVAFVGDFMLSGSQIGKSLKTSARFKKLFDSYDYRIATLETAIGEYNKIDSVKMPNSEVAVWSSSCDIGKLNQLGINVVSMANNHSCDCGIEMMLKVAEELRGIGIKTVGAGRNIQEAMNPVVLRKEGESLAIIGCCKDEPSSLGSLYFATSTKGGIFRLDESIILPYIKELKSQYNYVAVVVHWGVEHRWFPETRDVIIAKKMIEAGADAILGGHPHHIQPFVDYKRRPVFYSLGNFYFPDFCLDKVSNIYYPEKEQLSQLPRFDLMCPDKRNFPMLYFWRYYGRLGLIADLNTSNGKIGSNHYYSIFKNGQLDLSKSSHYHNIVLKLFSPFVGTIISKKANGLFNRIGCFWRYKFLSLFNKDYTFFKYLKEHNY